MSLRYKACICLTTGAVLLLANQGCAGKVSEGSASEDLTAPEVAEVFQSVVRPDDTEAQASTKTNAKLRVKSLEFHCTKAGAPVMSGTFIADSAGRGSLQVFGSKATPLFTSHASPTQDITLEVRSSIGATHYDPMADYGVGTFGNFWIRWSELDITAVLVAFPKPSDADFEKFAAEFTNPTGTKLSYTSLNSDMLWGFHNPADCLTTVSFDAGGS
jgi:hypothetical protein